MTNAIAAERLHGSAVPPWPVLLPTAQCTLDTVASLKEILRRHPGASPVHLRLVSSDRTLTLALNPVFGVTPSPALTDDLTALLGTPCLPPERGR